MSNQPECRGRFSTNSAHAGYFVEAVRSFVGAHLGRPVRVLDVGCGDGGKLFRLAECWPDASFTGIDIAEPNIRLAEHRRQESPHRDRIAFHAGDYRTFSARPHDLIVADGVLHLIPGPTDQLFARLVDHLAPGGLAVFSMPEECWYNWALLGVRRVLRACRSRLTDELALMAARLLHGRSHPDDFLRERLGYVYVLPFRQWSGTLEVRLTAVHGLDNLEAVRYRHTSPGQLRHRLWCFRRPPAAAAA